MTYWKDNPDLLVAAIFAVVTACFAPLSWDLYVSYANVPLLLTLCCLMLSIAGLSDSGLLVSLYTRCMGEEVTLRHVGRCFIFVSFFLSMVVTNDVALLLFVPLCIAVFRVVNAERYLIFVLTMQTIAANLGSMLTPIGNPQNLFLYAYYDMGLRDFFAVTAPITIISGILLYAASLYLLQTRLRVPREGIGRPVSRRAYVFVALFLLCIATVLRGMTPQTLVYIVVPVVAVTKVTIFRRVDYKLLGLFLLLFIGVGNLQHIPALAAAPETLVQGHVFGASILLSQGISNVPATVLLAPYTDDVMALLAGVNIGGLGTLIASMASIITLKAYANMPGRKLGQYVLFFTAANVGFLALLVAFWFGVGIRISQLY